MGSNQRPSDQKSSTLLIVIRVTRATECYQQFIYQYLIITLFYIHHRGNLSVFKFYLIIHVFEIKSWIIILSQRFPVISCDTIGFSHWFFSLVFLIGFSQPYTLLRDKGELKRLWSLPTWIDQGIKSQFIVWYSSVLLPAGCIHNCFLHSLST